MSRTASLLFEYLRDILYAPEHARLRVEELEEAYQPLGKGLAYLSSSLAEMRAFTLALSKGDLHIQNIPGGNELSAPLKALHANLRHLTWQSQQVAKGDYRQRVDFMGEFADAFNEMTRQLEQRQHALENEIRISREKTAALEQSNTLLTEIAFNIPQLLFVLGEQDRQLLFTNRAARGILSREASFLSQLVQSVGISEEPAQREDSVHFECGVGGETRHYTVQCYHIYWEGKNAWAYSLNDVSEELMRRMELETYAYRDNLTKLFNRYYGMRTLHSWLDQDKPFLLCFADLDNLKYINDTLGHAEGDAYIIGAAQALAAFSPGTVTCRIGGDEFLLLIPDMPEHEAAARMETLRRDITRKLESERKPYYSNISYGMVPSTFANSASALMGLADERMYENKRENKRLRQEKHRQAE